MQKRKKAPTARGLVTARLRTDSRKSATTMRRTDNGAMGAVASANSRAKRGPTTALSSQSRLARCASAWRLEQALQSPLSARIASLSSASVNSGAYRRAISPASALASGSTPEPSIASAQKTRRSPMSAGAVMRAAKVTATAFTAGMGTHTLAEIECVSAVTRCNQNGLRHKMKPESASEE
eukprot:Amastigsp_a6997_24.p3 type:complete len:181 gc:universal Amastigsp_a6997_24:981-439(-)